MANTISTKGKIFVILLGFALLFGIYKGYQFFFPKQVKKANITTKATTLPPLTYDKNSNATFRELPEFNEAVDIQSPQVRGALMGWNATSAITYAVGGLTTSKGSLAEELGLNISLSVQNSTMEQGNQLYAFAEALHNGEPNPTKGVHFVNWMGDGVANYLTGLNARITKDFGEEFRAEVIYPAGASFGEDKWLVKAKYLKDARGSLTATVIRDGDWNICIIKSQLMGWPINHDLGTYDRSKINFVAAPNDDYVEAGKLYISGQKITLKLVENGKYTGKDTTLAVTGVSTWFPADQQVVQQKGGLVVLASTKDFGAQMACNLIVIKKWADDNRPIVEKMIEAFGRAGDQIKSHDEALKFACRVNEIVYNDKEKDADAWYNGFKSFTVTDDDGNEVSIGGSRVFSLADAAYYAGIAGGSDKYKQIYETFGAICVEAYPEVLSSYLPYEKAVDWSFLRAVWNKNKGTANEGKVSKIDFTQSQKGGVVGDAAYSIEFNLNSAEIKPESYAILDKIVGQLNIADNTFVEIAGHTDVSGNDADNLSLSERRARSVMEYIISKYPELLENKRVTSKGYGETQPLKEVDPSSSKNRRVEIKLFKVR